MTGSPDSLQPRRTAFFWLAIACFLGAAVCVAAYLGSCASLVDGDTGGKGELGAIIFAAIFAVVGFFVFWPRRYRKMQ